MLKKCLGDPASILPVKGSGVYESLSYEEVSIEILDRQVKRLRNKEIATMKVLWRNHLIFSVLKVRYSFPEVWLMFKKLSFLSAVVNLV